MLEGKRVFVSGGAGVIGQALIKKLNELGAKIFIGDLKLRPKNWNEKISYRRGDLNYITKKELEYIGPEYFFHLAATFERSEETYDFWDLNFRHNVNLSHHLMNCLKDSRTLQKVIFASSYLIYHPALYSSSTIPNKSIRLKESDTIYPRNTCGAAKLLHEMELDFLTKFDNTRFKIICARIFRVYGKNSRDVISRWIRDLLKGNSLTVYKPENLFDYIFADDVAEGLIRLATNPAATGIVNLGNDNSRRISEVLEILRTHFPDMKTTLVKKDIQFEASQADMDLFKKITGWSPTKQLEDGIPEIIQFEKNKLSYQEISNEINVLVTSVSKKTSLLTAIRKAMSKIGNDGFITGGDVDPNCIGKYFVDRFWQMPTTDDLSMVEFIQYCKDNKITCVIPTRDNELLYFANHKKKLEENGIHVMVSKSDSVKICIDKLAFYNYLKTHGFPYVKTTKNIDEIESKFYVVKDQFGAGSREIGYRLSKENAIMHAKSILNPIFQPFIEGKEYSVDLYIGKNSKTKGMIVRSRDVVVNGESQITTSVSNMELEKICSDLAEQLDLYGHVIIQAIKDNNGNYQILECNPRFGGASSLSIHLGLDSFYWFLIESSGESLDNYLFLRSPTERKQIRYSEDLVI